MPTFQPFNASIVPLKGTNLIEASAGTGKTYSIAILVFRMILEKKLSINEILMVTFTKAAVAELEGRIRLFVRTALRVARGEQVDDKTIARLVESAIDASTEGEVIRLLQNAVQLLDETSVQTIHSFCQHTLDEFALEAHQRYNAEMIEDVSELMEHYVNDFWRTQVVTLPVWLLKLMHLNSAYFSMMQIKSVVNSQMSGKNFAIYDRSLAYQFDSVYINEIEAQMLAIAEDDVAIKGLSLQVVQRLLCRALRVVLPAIEQHKKHHNLLTYDDMIVNLHEALVVRDGKLLSVALQNKFKAVFIDEFQDTDKYQYEIFSRAFHGSDTVLFYIGDPKQSIYSWRKADINTYFRAYHEADYLYGMNENYRSSVPMIEAMNHFFEPKSKFDAFAFGGAEDAIRYIEVASPVNNSKGLFIRKGQLEPPITIFDVAKKDLLLKPLGAQVAEILSDEQTVIEKNGVKRRVTPSDIGILVRTNKDAQSVKDVLAGLGIPAITIGDAKVFQSEEARYLLYLLQGFENLTQGDINKALLSPFTGFQIADVLALDAETVGELFRNYRDIWRKSGIYLTIKTFLSDFNVHGCLLGGDNELGERVIANFYHVTELLHKAETRNHFSQIELIGWLKRGIEGDQSADDELQLRLESDEEAVSIVTIHRSKGLEYNIVIAPNLDLIVKSPFPEVSWRESLDGMYQFSFRDWVGNTPQEMLCDEQIIQENRRLLYVAVTRAVYKCYIFKVNMHRGVYSTKDSALSAFVSELRKKNDPLIVFTQCPFLKPGFNYHSTQKMQSPSYLEANHFALAQTNWCKMSYSFLAEGHERLPKLQTLNYVTDYDRFIFGELVKGAKTGDMLHYIFEHVDFSDPQRWEKLVDVALGLFMPRFRTEYAQMLLRMLQEVFRANIRVDGEVFQLSSVSLDKRINEMEFDFMMPRFEVESLNNLSSPNRLVLVRPIGEKEGVMNGKIDLFFEHNGKYYVLDWKSNYLGDTLECYTPEKLNDAMSENNYHLQYLIYTTAVNKYLKSRLPDYHYDTHFGGVIYLFVRGARSGAESGVFVCRPEGEEILK